AAWKNLFAAFDGALRLLHPFMPFLTEELWHQLPQAAGALSIALDEFPTVPEGPLDTDAKNQISLLQDVIVAARNIRAEMKLDMKSQLQPRMRVSSDSIRTCIEQNIETIERLGRVTRPAFVAAEFDSTKGV